VPGPGDESSPAVRDSAALPLYYWPVSAGRAELTPRPPYPRTLKRARGGRVSVMLCFTVELSTFKTPRFKARGTGGGNRTPT
jgi:hypothetical protein